MYGLSRQGVGVMKRDVRGKEKAVGTGWKVFFLMESLAEWGKNVHTKKGRDASRASGPLGRD